MLFIEFQPTLHDGLNLLKYRNIDDDIWYYMYIDIETLHLLLTNFGIISTRRIPGKFTNCDNPSTSPIVNINYCGANIQSWCGQYSADKIPRCLQHIEQNY